MELGLTQRQGQSLSPQMIQSVEMLQMPSQEFLVYLETAAQENPVLELQESGDFQGTADEANELFQKLEWLESNDPQNRDYHHQDSDAEEELLRSYGTAEMGETTLYRHLLNQVQTMELSPEIECCVRFLAASLDDRGWLEEDVSDLAQELNQPAETMERALAVVQSLEPAGIAARNLSECLCLQLLRQIPVDRLALRIAEAHLNSLAKNRYGLIARTLQVEQDEVHRACDVIRSLDPRPGASFAACESPVYIIPDVIVSNVSGQFELMVNDRFFPILHISPYYTQLLRESSDQQVRDYLTGKVRQAKWMIRAVEQRKSTLTACVQSILEHQESFFRDGPGHLCPMSLSDIAQKVGIHESTVSRAISGKYLQCAQGTYPLNYFFSRRLGAENKAGAVSPDAAKALLKQLISQEDKCRPLSDQKLCERMALEGCVLARRTVAKYRDELGISGTAGRKQ